MYSDRVMRVKTLLDTRFHRPVTAARLTLRWEAERYREHDVLE